MEIELSRSEYRPKGVGRSPRPKFSVLELLSFSIASTWATRKHSPPDTDRNARLLAAGFMGLATYFTSGGG